MLNIIQIFMPGRGQLVTPKVGEGDQIYRYAINNNRFTAGKTFCEIYPINFIKNSDANRGKPHTYNISRLAE